MQVKKKKKKGKYLLLLYVVVSWGKGLVRVGTD